MNDPHALPLASVDEQWEDSMPFSDEQIAWVREQSREGCLLCALAEWEAK